MKVLQCVTLASLTVAVVASRADRTTEDNHGRRRLDGHSKGSKKADKKGGKKSDKSDKKGGRKPGKSGKHDGKKSHKKVDKISKEASKKHATPKDSGGNCEYFELYGIVDELIAQVTSVGESWLYPLYDPVTDEEVGSWYDKTTNFGEEDPEDCLYNLAISLPGGSIAIQSTCNLPSNAIVGGSGDWACATGKHDVFRNADNTLRISQFWVCIPEICGDAIFEEFPEEQSIYFS